MIKTIKWTLYNVKYFADKASYIIFEYRVRDTNTIDNNKMD